MEPAVIGHGPPDRAIIAEVGIDDVRAAELQLALLAVRQCLVGQGVRDADPGRRRDDVAAAAGPSRRRGVDRPEGCQGKGFGRPVDTGEDRPTGSPGPVRELRGASLEVRQEHMAQGQPGVVALLLVGDPSDEVVAADDVRHAELGHVGDDARGLEHGLEEDGHPGQQGGIRERRSRTPQTGGGRRA